MCYKVAFRCLWQWMIHLSTRANKQQPVISLKFSVCWQALLWHLSCSEKSLLHAAPTQAGDWHGQHSSWPETQGLKCVLKVLRQSSLSHHYMHPLCIVCDGCYSMITVVISFPNSKTADFVLSPICDSKRGQIWRTKLFISQLLVITSAVTVI